MKQHEDCRNPFLYRSIFFQKTGPWRCDIFVEVVIPFYIGLFSFSIFLAAVLQVRAVVIPFYIGLFSFTIPHNAIYCQSYRIVVIPFYIGLFSFVE